MYKLQIIACDRLHIIKSLVTAVHGENLCVMVHGIQEHGALGR